MRSISSFIAALKGPCIAIMCPLSKPSSAHFFITSGSGSTRTKRRERSLTRAKAANSLLPVVSSTLPDVFSMCSAASAALFTRSEARLASLARRSTRISGTLHAAQAARIFSLAPAA